MEDINDQDFNATCRHTRPSQKDKNAPRQARDAHGRVRVVGINIERIKLHASYGKRVRCRPGNPTNRSARTAIAARPACRRREAGPPLRRATNRRGWLVRPGSLPPMGLLNSSRKKPCKIQRATLAVSWNRLGFRSGGFLRLLTAPRQKMILRSAKKDIEARTEASEKDGFTVADESRQNSNSFGSCAVCVLGAEPVHTPPAAEADRLWRRGARCAVVFHGGQKGKQQAVHHVPDKLWCRFVKVAGIADNTAYHHSRRVRLHLEGNGSLVKLPFLSPYSPLLDTVECFGPRARTRCAGRSGGRPRDTLCRRHCLFMSRSK